MRKDIEFGIDIGYIAASVGWENAAKMMGEAGFTLVDYNPPIWQENWKDDMKWALDLFERNGLRVHQTHAPFFRYAKFDEAQAVQRERLYESTVLMGAEFMVVHGDEYNSCPLEYSPENAFKHNYDLFAPYVERAEKDGVKVAFETVFADGCMGYDRFTAKAEELRKLIFAYNSDAAVCCWDFGHANVSFGKEHADVIRSMEGKVACTHVHDNQGRHDDHLLPFQGNIDWKACVDALRETGYNGQFVYELVYGKIPPELMPEYLHFLKKTAEHICSL